MVQWGAEDFSVDVDEDGPLVISPSCVEGIAVPSLMDRVVEWIVSIGQIGFVGVVWPVGQGVKGFSPGSDTWMGRLAKGSAPLGSGCRGRGSSGASGIPAVETGWSHSMWGAFCSSHSAVTSLSRLSAGGAHSGMRNSRFCWNHTEMAAYVICANAVGSALILTGKAGPRHAAHTIDGPEWVVAHHGAPWWARRVTIAPHTTTGVLHATYSSLVVSQTEQRWWLMFVVVVRTSLGSPNPSSGFGGIGVDIVLRERCGSKVGSWTLGMRILVRWRCLISSM